MRISSLSLRYAIVLALGSLTGACGDNGMGVGIPSGAVGPGRIAGRISQGEQGVGGLRVVIVGRDSTQTDASGAYLFDGLQPAFYTINLRLLQGQTLEAGQSTIRNANVGSGKTSRVDWRLSSRQTGVSTQ